MSVDDWDIHRLAAAIADTQASIARYEAMKAHLLKLTELAAAALPGLDVAIEMDREQIAVFESRMDSRLSAQAPR